MIPKNESGHPIKHVFTTAIPSSQCMTCHMHPGTNMVTTYQGLTWWDNETDGDKMYPAGEPQAVDAAARRRSRSAIPKGSALRGLWWTPSSCRSTGIAGVQQRS